MSVRVRWSLRAVQRASEAALYIAARDRRTAERWVRGLFDAIRLLARLPLRGRVVAEIGRLEIRELIFRDHRVIYRVSPRLIEILTVRHSRRLLDPLEIEGSS